MYGRWMVGGVLVSERDFVLSVVRKERKRREREKKKKGKVRRVLSSCVRGRAQRRGSFRSCQCRRYGEKVLGVRTTKGEKRARHASAWVVEKLVLYRQCSCGGGWGQGRWWRRRKGNSKSMQTESNGNSKSMQTESNGNPPQKESNDVFQMRQSALLLMCLVLFVVYWAYSFALFFLFSFLFSLTAAVPRGRRAPRDRRSGGLAPLSPGGCYRQGWSCAAVC